MQLWALLCLLACAVAGQQPIKVKVDVYYESLCPDSRKFITTQLYPTLQTNLGQYVNLTLIPYGKSTTQVNGNEVEFTCHHGANECWGNRLHACALKSIRTPETRLGFIACLMQNSQRNDNQRPEEVFQSREKCALEKNVDNLKMLETCTNHPDGANYLEMMGKLTDALQKPLKSVPTVVFRGEIKPDGVNDFRGVLCSYLGTDKPAECSKSAAAGAPASAVAGVMALSAMALALH